MLSRVDYVLRLRVAGWAVAVTRVMLGLALLITSLESFLVLSRIAEGAMAYPFVDGVPQPSTVTASGVLVLGWLAGLCLVVGLLPHIMAGVGAALGALTLMWDQQLYSSHLTLLTVLLALLAFAESDRHSGLSRKRHTSTDGRVPWWPQMLMMSQVSALYLFAGLSKAQPTFLGGEPLGEWMWADLPPVAYVILSWATVITEIALAIALWIPRTREMAVAVGIVLHLSIVTMLDGENLWLVAFALTITATYPLFLTRPTRTVSHTLAASQDGKRRIRR